MQGFCSFDQLEQAFQHKLNEKQHQQASEQLHQQAKSDLQHRLENFCTRLEQLKAAYEQNGLLDDDYETLKIRLGQYRHQLKFDLDDLVRRLVEIRQSDSVQSLTMIDGEFGSVLDPVEQLIEDRRQQQAQELAELNLNRQQREALQQQRQTKQAELMQLIAEQENFFEASLLAIDVYTAMPDLKAIGGLETVVDALLAKINACNQAEKIINLVGTPQQKLSQMYRKALEFRNGGSLSMPERSGKPKKPNRSRPEAPSDPDPYADLKGKVVIFGGHTATKNQVKERLSNVTLVWCTLEEGERSAQQAAAQIATANLVILLTDDAKHKTTNIAETAAKRYGKKPVRFHREGQRSLVSYIALHLKFKT
jgi:Uncharacterized protein conserved in bacteria (DUF2325)